MKKAHLGMLLFVSGGIGFLVLSLYLSANPHIYNEIDGILGALLGNELLVPYAIFCLLGIAGLAICIYEAYFRSKRM